MEYFDLLDENGNKTGATKLRNEVHRDGDWHRTAHIWIIDKNGNVLLQRRSATKDSKPNMLDISCAGHLIAGDNPLDGAIRELKEELNLDVAPNELHYIKTEKHSSRYSNSFINNEFSDIYILITDKTLSDMKYQKDEISEIMFVPYEKLKTMISSKQPDLVLTKESCEVLFEYFDNPTF